MAARWGICARIPMGHEEAVKPRRWKLHWGHRSKGWVRAQVGEHTDLGTHLVGVGYLLREFETTAGPRRERI